MSEPLSPERLAAIADRAAHAYEYDPSEQAQVLAGADVPALLAEVERLRAALSSATDVIAERDDEIGDWSAKNAALRAELHYAQLKRDDNWRQVEHLRAERDRYRSAWQSARFRAEARGEGILREVKNRDFWRREAERLRSEILRAEKATGTTHVEALTEIVLPSEPCGYDDYHDPHQWAGQEYVWCPGHAEAGESK